MTDQSDIGFEEQLRLEKVERETSSSGVVHGHTKTDPDGTVYEWDAHKQAWFPKIDDDFIAQYQMNYGNFSEDKEKEGGQSSEKKDIPPPPPVTDPSYAHWYYTYYSTQADSQKSDSVKTTDSSESDQAYNDYWAYYYQYYNQNTQGKEKTGEEKKSDEEERKTGEKDEGKGKGKSEGSDEGNIDGKKEEKDGDGGSEGGEESTEYNAEEYEEYCKKYKEYYEQYYKQGGGEEEGSSEDYWKWYYSYYGQNPEGEPEEGKTKEGEEEKKEEEAAGKDKKGMKRKLPNAPPKWFEMDPEKSTSVYISGLPDNITDEDFRTLMTKCGLIMMDPFSGKFKLKLYRDKDGNIKGDGVCSYIKKESVDLAMQILDDYDYNGHKLKVEIAKFELKGEFDPTKRKKLSNKAKRKLKEKQEKLFDWRPDKLKGFRPKSDRVLVLKNVFDCKDFEKDPTLINEIRNDLRVECEKYGEVRKVIVYDRHEDGVCTVAFKEIEQADVCRDALNHRWFAQRRLVVATWDGKTKYEVRETEEERKARINKWNKFLEDNEDDKKKEKKKEKQDEGQKKDSSVHPASVKSDSEKVDIKAPSRDPENVEFTSSKSDDSGTKEEAMETDVNTKSDSQ